MTLEEIKADIVARKALLEQQSKDLHALADALTAMEDSVDSAVSSLEDAIAYLADAINPEEPEEEE